MQKIIAGSARGRVLKSLPLDHDYVRPILGRIKKSLFDILTPRLAQCRFLDIYAGTGSVGLEALSRGARFAAFVERDASCLSLLKKNLEMFNFTSQADVVRVDGLGPLQILGAPFDIVFMGPPYVDEKKNALSLTLPTIENVLRFSLLAPAGVLVAQHHKKEIVDPLPAGVKRIRQERYGDTLVDFITH